VAVVVKGAPAKRAPTICLLRKCDNSHILRYFPMNCHYTQSVMHWH
jgi:hypothetical protein